MTPKLPYSTVPIPDPTILTTQSLQREISSLKELFYSEIKHVQEIEHDHFERVHAKFDERKAQMDIALEGQRESARVATDSINITIGKMDASYTKLFDQMQLLVSTTVKNFDDKINDIKSRIDRGEGHHTGVSSLWGVILGGGSFILALITLSILVFRFTHGT